MVDGRAVIGADEAVEAVASVLTRVLAKPGDELNPNQLALDHALARKVVAVAEPIFAAAARERCARLAEQAADSITDDQALSWFHDTVLRKFAASLRNST